MITSFTSHDLLESSYESLRNYIIFVTEKFGKPGHPGEVYFDSSPEQYPTIGMGFNLDDSGTRNAVINYFFMGDPAATLLGDDLVFASDIASIISSATSESQLRIDLNAKMQDRYDYYRVFRRFIG